MIIIQDKYNADIKIPRNPSYNGRFDLRIFSPIGLWERSYYVIDDYSSKQFYHFQVDLWSLPDGEFNYILESEESGEAAATGIIQIGNGKAEDEYLQYEYEIEYLQYYPFQAEIVLKVPEESLKYDDTELEFTIYSNVDWVYTIYRNGSQYGNTIHGSKGKSKQYIEIPTNPTKELVIWHIACGDEEGDISVSKDVWQHGLPLSVSITSPSPTIASDATEIPFTITYDEWQTTRVGTIYLYKDGEQEQTMPLNYYPLTFSSAFTISPNLTYSKINYDLKVVVDATPNQPMISAATRVIQDEANYLIMSADSYTLAATDTSLSWSYSANTNWTLTAITPWGTGTSPKTAGSDTLMFYFEQNTTLSARTFTYQGQTSDGQASQTLTFIQAASGTPIPPSPSADSSTRFSILMLEDGDILWDGVSVLYSKNGDDGYQLDHGVFDLEAGDVIEFYVDSDVRTNRYSQHPITSTAQHIVYGNIMSLFYVDFEDATDFPSKYVDFRRLFYGDTGLISAENLILPATALTENCYQEMFKGCTGLTSTPSELPATTLDRACYQHMFNGCTSLVYVPSELPAENLSSSCYYSMFYGCSSLNTTPILPATTLAKNCYSGMFAYCTNLQTAPALPAPVLADSCYEMMFNECSKLNSITCYATDISASSATYIWAKNVAATGDFWKMSSVTWTTGINGIPEGWTSHNIDR